MVTANNSKRARFTESALKALPHQDRLYRVYSEDVPGWVVFVHPAPSENVTHYVTYKHGGRRLFYKVPGHFRRVSSIKAEAKRLLGEVAQGIDIQAVKREEKAARKAAAQAHREAEARTLRAYIASEYEPHVLRTQGSSGRETYRRLMREWGEILDTDMEALTADQVTRIVRRRKSEVAIHTVVRDVVVLRAMLNHARDAGKLSRDPLPSRKRLFPEGIPSDERVRYLADDERKRLEARLEGPQTPPYLRIMVRLALLTGMRRGELFGLTWGKVDLRAGHITVTARTAKSNRTRHVPLTAAAVAMLKGWRGDAVPMPGALVFPNPDSGKPFVTIKKAWAGLMQRAEIEGFRLHDCRHDYASRLVMAGVPLYDVSTLLGHSSIELTQRYAHLAPDHLKKAVEALS